MKICVGDIIEMKKTHPCGGRRWIVLRTGMDIKMRCEVCGHEIMCERHKIEKNIKRIVDDSEVPS